MSFSIYIFTSSEFKRNEYRFGTTQICDIGKFKKYWNKKFSTLDIKYQSNNIPIIKQSCADKLIKKHVDKSFRIITTDLNNLINIANNIEQYCLKEFEKKEEKESKYIASRLQESELIQQYAYEDDYEEYDENEDTIMTVSDEEFIDNSEV